MHALDNVVSKYGIVARMVYTTEGCSLCVFSSLDSKNVCSLPMKIGNNVWWCSGLDYIINNPDRILSFSGSFVGNRGDFLKDIADFLAMANAHQ